MSEESERLQRAQAVKRKYEITLLQKKNVVGVGVGYRERAGRLTEEIAIVVNVSRKLPARMLAADDLIPETLDGVPVDVREVGALRAL